MQIFVKKFLPGTHEPNQGMWYVLNHGSNVVALYTFTYIVTRIAYYDANNMRSANLCDE